MKKRRSNQERVVRSRGSKPGLLNLVRFKNLMGFENRRRLLRFAGSVLNSITSNCFFAITGFAGLSQPVRSSSSKEAPLPKDSSAIEDEDEQDEELN